MIEEYIKIIKDINLNPKTILEIGSRDGDDAKKLSNEFKITDNNIHIVEPNPIMCDFIIKKYPSYNLYKCAIGDTEGRFKFNQVNSEDLNIVGVSSLLDRNDNFYIERETKQIYVDVIRGDSLLKSINKEIDLCKIDVEGLTYEVLDSFSDKINLIKTFHLETEIIEIWKGQKTHNQVVLFLKQNNYECLYQEKVWGGSQLDTIWVKKELI